MKQKERLADLVTMGLQQKPTYPLWWESRNVGFITTQLSSMGWRKPQHFTQKRKHAKRLTKVHYLK